MLREAYCNPDASKSIIHIYIRLYIPVNFMHDMCLPSFFNLSYLPIYATFSFRRPFIVNSKIYMQEMVKCYSRITHLHRPNRIRIQIQWEHVNTCPRITEQTGHVLETEIVAGVFPPVAKDDNEYSIVPSSALKTLATIVHTIQSSHVCYMVESRVLQSKVI